jgi:hypothetical protein
MASTSSNTVVVIEPVLMKAKKELTGGRKRGKGDFMPELPPLPLESDLFTPRVGERIMRKADLKVLAEAVMNMMTMEGKFVVEVDKMARVLETKKDKVFAICNVMEGLRLMLRQSMNVYMWQGRTALMSTLMMLKQMAEKEDMMGQLSMVRNFINQDSMESSGLKYNLVMMSQKLMMMFMTLPQSSPLLLLEASIIIHGPVLTDIKRKSSMQRLGDIAKILGSVGLVAKVINKKGDSKKNISYRYVGQEVPQLLFALNTQCEDVEMEEDLAAVRDIVEENIEGEEFATGAAGLRRKLSKLEQVGEENV